MIPGSGNNGVGINLLIIGGLEEIKVEVGGTGGDMRLLDKLEIVKLLDS